MVYLETLWEKDLRKDMLLLLKIQQFEMLFLELRPKKYQKEGVYKNNQSLFFRPEKDNIYLHLNHLPAELLHERLPGIREATKIFAGVGQKQLDLPNNAGEAAIARIDRLTHHQGLQTIAQVRKDLQRTMQKHAAFFRIEKTEKVKDIYSRKDDDRIKDKGLVWNSHVMEGIRIREFIIKELRCAHARDDYPDRGDKNWMKHTLARIQVTKSGDAQLIYRDVITKTMDPKEFDTVPPKKSVY